MSWVAKYIGIRFVDHGRSEAGVDCWGLVRLVYHNERGIWLPTFVDSYTDTSSGAEIRSLLDANLRRPWEEVTAAEAEEFDLVLFALPGGEWHLGLVVEPRRGIMLHAQRPQDTVTERYREPRWRNVLDSVWHLGAAA